MRIGRFAFGECSSMPLPPGSDDAISSRSPLRPPRKSFVFALRTAVSPPGRCIGTRECRNVKPLRLRDTALATLIRYLLRLRFCTPLPLCYTLFQRLALLSDTSLVQSAFRQRLLAPFSTASRIVTIIASFPLGGALALFALRQSGFIASMLTRYTNSLRSSASFPCNRLRQHCVPVGTSEQESVAM